MQRVAKHFQPASDSNAKLQSCFLLLRLQRLGLKHTLHSQVSASDVELADHEPT